MRTLITVCARGGSKGIPGKNIKLLNEKPLIYYTIQVAEEFAKSFQDVDIVLSSDSGEIKSVVEKGNFHLIDITYNRPPVLATDKAGKLDVIKGALEYAEKRNNFKYDYIIDLDVTSPLRCVNDIENAFHKLKSDRAATNIFSVSKAARNPYFNMVEFKGDTDYVQLVKNGSFLTRQSSPEVFDMNASFYIWKRNFFFEEWKNNITENTLVYIMPHICFDLDEPIDFEFMSFLIKNDRLDFKF